MSNSTIHVDALGLHQPTSTISHFGGSYGKGGYLAFQTTSNSPDEGTKWENTPETIATIPAWAEEHGYDIVERKDGHGAYRADLTHRATKKAMEDKISSATVGYIRYGNLPKGGKSKNHHTGELEAGVSVFEALFYPDGSYELQANTTMIRSLMSGGLLKRNVYRLYGDVVGTGSDGEPVLKVAKAELIAK